MAFDEKNEAQVFGRFFDLLSVDVHPFVEVLSRKQ
jgi:hypothetical protein